MTAAPIPDGAQVDRIYARNFFKVNRNVDRMFGLLLLSQWGFAVLLAAWVSPYSWTGSIKSIHLHVQLAVLLGGALNALPLWLAWKRPGERVTRLTISAVQGLWSGLLIHLSGGRIETHFHIFGSLALLSFYRDWRALVPMTVVVTCDHLLRGIFLPESIFAVPAVEGWRWLEHTGWIMFEVLFLTIACVRSEHEMRVGAYREAKVKVAYSALEAANALVENKVIERTAQLEATQARYKAVLEACNAVPYELDLEAGAVFSYIAPQAERMFGWPLDRFREPGFLASLTHPDDHPAVRQAFLNAPIGAIAAAEYRLRRMDGHYLTVRNEFVRVESSEGRHVFRGLALDITQRRSLELELRQAQKLESVGRLAAGVAHEINTPVQFVSDSVQFVQEAMLDLVPLLASYRVQEIALPAEAGRALAVQREEIDLEYLLEQVPRALVRSLDGLGRVADIVRSMKEFAHPDQRKLVATDLNAAIRATLTIARSEYKLVADVQTQLGALPRVVCCAGEVNQVLLNLIVNAAQAISEVANATHKRGLIRISTAEEGEEAVVTISDTGNGIDPAIRERVFDPFFTTKEVGKGTGQGLAIARTVVEDKHQGKLTFVSEVGLGTTFTMRLPIAGPRV